MSKTTIQNFHGSGAYFFGDVKVQTNNLYNGDITQTIINGNVETENSSKEVNTTVKLGLGDALKGMFGK